MSSSLLKIFLRVFQYFSRKPLTSRLKDEQDEVKGGKFYQKELMQVIYQWSQWQQSRFLMNLLRFLQTTHSGSLQTFCRINWIGKNKKINGRLHSQKHSTYQCIKMLQSGSSCFFMWNFKNPQNFIIRNAVSTLSKWIPLMPKTPSLNGETIRAKFLKQLKCLKERKKRRLGLGMKDLVLPFLVRICSTFSEGMLAMNLG